MSWQCLRLSMVLVVIGGIPPAYADEELNSSPSSQSETSQAEELAARTRFLNDAKAIFDEADQRSPKDLLAAASILAAIGNPWDSSVTDSERVDSFEKAVFLMWAACIRLRFDLACFPPSAHEDNVEDLPSLPYTRPAGDNILLWIWHVASKRVLSKLDGADISETEYLKRIDLKPEVEACDRAFERLKTWKPKLTEAYQPQYDFRERLEGGEAWASIQEEIQKSLADIHDSVRLLKDDEYREVSVFLLHRKMEINQDDLNKTNEKWLVELAESRLEAIRKRLQTESRSSDRE